MKISYDNRRLTVADCSEQALTTPQKLIFARWQAGFEAQGAGKPITDCPHFAHWAHKVRRVWMEGWNAGAAVDRMASQVLV